MQQENGIGGSRKKLTPAQVDALRKRVKAFQDAISRLLPGPTPRVGTAAMLYLTSLILEMKANSFEDKGLALLQRRSTLEKLSQRLGRAPTVEDIEAHMQEAVPFEADLGDFLRQDLEAGPMAERGRPGRQGQAGQGRGKTTP